MTSQSNVRVIDTPEAMADGLAWLKAKLGNQARMGGVLGLDQSTMSRGMKGKAPFPPFVRKRLQDVLAEYGWDGTAPEPPSVQQDKWRDVLVRLDERNSRAALAKALGVSPPYICQMLLRRTTISANIGAKLAALAGMEGGS